MITEGARRKVSSYVITGGGTQIEVYNNEKAKATLGGWIEIPNDKKAGNFKGLFNDGKIDSLVIKKCTNGRLVGQPLYDGYGGKVGQQGSVWIDSKDPEVVKFANEIIRKYN